MSCKNVTWVTKSRTTLYSDWFQYCAGLWAGSGWSVPLSVCLTACKLVFITETRSWEPETVCHIVTLSPANIVISQSRGNINETRSRYSRTWACAVCSQTHVHAQSLPSQSPIKSFTSITWVPKKRPFRIMAIFLKVRFLGHSAYILKHSIKVVLVGVHVHRYSWSWSGIIK